MGRKFKTKRKRIFKENDMKMKRELASFKLLNKNIHTRITSFVVDDIPKISLQNCEYTKAYNNKKKLKIIHKKFNLIKILDRVYISRSKLKKNKCILIVKIFYETLTKNFFLLSQLMKFI